MASFTHVCLSDIGAPVAVLDDRLGIVDVSPPGARLLVRAGIALDVSPAPLPKGLVTALETAAVGETTEWTPERSGSPFHLGCTRYPLAESHFLLVMKEVSGKHRRLWEKLHRQRLESMGRLVASVVHELRAPLGSLSLNASMLGSRISSLDVTGRMAAQDIVHAIERLERSIQVLLDFARIGPPVRDVLSIREPLGGVQQLLRSILREGGHELRVEVEPEAAWVVGNRLVIEQILVNLLMNAVEATEGTTRVEVRSSRIAPDRIAVSIQDHGPGVPEALRHRLFSYFFTTKAQGTGIGLATAREAARHLGGDLRYEASSMGARFVLELPAAPEGAPQREQP